MTVAVMYIGGSGRSGKQRDTDLAAVAGRDPAASVAHREFHPGRWIVGVVGALRNGVQLIGDLVLCVRRNAPATTAPTSSSSAASPTAAWIATMWPARRTSARSADGTALPALTQSEPVPGAVHGGDHLLAEFAP